MCSLKVRFTQSPERRGVFEYALRVEVISAEGIPSKIFVYHQMPKGIEGNTFAEFDHVATPVDFQEIPEDSASDTVPWYRTDKVTVWMRNASDLDTAKQLLVNDISWLQKAYNYLSSENDFTVQETVDFHGEGERTHPSKEEEDSMSRRIDKIEEELKNKVDNDVLSGVDIAANTADGMRESIGVIGNVLGATVRSLSAFLCLSCLTAFGAEVYTAEYNTLNLDTHPSIVTNVTFDGLAMTSNTYTKAETDAKAEAATNYTNWAIGTNNAAFVEAVLAAPIAGADQSDLAEISEYGSYGTVSAAILALIAGLAALKRRIGAAETAISNKVDAADLRYRIAEAVLTASLPAGVTAWVDGSPREVTIEPFDAGWHVADPEIDAVWYGDGTWDSGDNIFRDSSGEPVSPPNLDIVHALADRTVNLITEESDIGASIDIELPAAATVDGVRYCRDFILDVDNSANASDLALEFTALGADYAFVPLEDDSISDVMTIGGGKRVRLYFTETPLRAGAGALPVINVACVTLGDFVTSTTTTQGGN